MAPTTLYLMLSFLADFIFTMIFTVSQIYYVINVGMSPLQLVLAGTILETSIFLFEVPTGVIADLKSRRLSIIIGYFIMGFGFLMEGALPFFWSVALAQVLWGLGYTFTSGATEAWIADEIGSSNAGDTYLRSSQWGNAGALVAIPLAVLLGNIQVNLPILIGGAALIGLGALLVLSMKETGFTPAPAGNRSTWKQMANTIAQARDLVRRQPVLLGLLGIAFFSGLYSEGLDRLWTPHLIENFEFPLAGTLTIVTWFGVIRAVGLLLSILGTWIVRQRVDLQLAHRIGNLSRFASLGIILGLLSFGLTTVFWLALIFYWLITMLRSIRAPLHTTWVNLNVDDPQVRATLLSVNSQTDAIGQIAGGPVIGLVGNVSIRAALAASALLLTPVIALYTRALRGEHGRGEGSH